MGKTKKPDDWISNGNGPASQTEKEIKRAEELFIMNEKHDVQNKNQEKCAEALTISKNELAVSK